MVQWEKEIGLISGIKSLTFEGMATGPPGAPIEVWIQGHDMEDILAASEDLMHSLQQFEGVYQIRSDFSPGKNEMRLSLKPEARTLGLTVDDLARQVYTGYFGEEALRLQRGRDDIKVKVRYTADERTRISDFEKIRIRYPHRPGNSADIRRQHRILPGYSTIIRTNGMRRVSVSAGVDTNKANANEIVTELNAAYFPELTHRYPGTDHRPAGGTEKDARILWQSLCGLSPGGYRYHSSSSPPCSALICSPLSFCLRYPSASSGQCSGIW